MDLIEQITVTEPYEWTEPCPWDCEQRFLSNATAKNVVVYDFGVKRNILRSLVSVGAKVVVVPAFTTFEQLLAFKPDGIVLSNGPGNPARLERVVGEIRKMIGHYPLFGICLGHQLLAQAFGAKTYKMKYGHRGANQPVLFHEKKLVEITSQNHGFCIDRETLPQEIEVTHTNLNDGTIEGFRHRDLPVFSVQYHPEAAAGPHDTAYLFRRFLAGNDVE